MREALRCVATYLLALLVTLLVGASWLLDGTPSETDALQATALDLIDAVAQAALKDQP